MAEVNNDNTVAVLGLPHLATALSESGLSVVSGETVREAASTIQVALKAGPIPVILADAAAPMLNAWFTKVIAMAPTVLVRVTSAAGPIAAPGAQRIDAPASVNDILGAVGLPGVMPGAVLGGDGEVAGSGASANEETEPQTHDVATVEDADDWFEQVTEPAPTTAAEPAAKSVDGWSDLGWDDPEEVTESTPPQPSFTTPAVAAAPVEEDDWSDLGWDVDETPKQPESPPQPTVRDAVADPSLPPAFPEHPWEAPPASSPIAADGWDASVSADTQSASDDDDDDDDDDWAAAWSDPTPAAPPLPCLLYTSPSPRD